MSGVSDEAPARYLRGGGHHVRPDDGGGAVHGEVDARLENRGPDHGHDGHEGFGEHGAIADHRNLALVLEHFRRGARRDQCVEPGNRAASDGDEQEGEQAARPDRAAAVHELRDRRHLQFRLHDQDAHREQRHRADLKEGRQVVARREQQPDRQDGRHKSVADDEQGERLGVEREHDRQFRRLGHGTPVNQRQPAAARCR